jgi:hypothetical protein
LTAISGGKQKRRLDVVRAPLQSQSSIPFFVLCATVLVSSLVAVLVLNTSMVYTSYEAARLSNQVTQTRQDVQAKTERLRQIQNALPAKADRLGMVPAQNPQVLDISQAAAQVLAGSGGQ